MQNGFVESFKGRLRDECLNETLFTSLPHARLVLDAWRDDYNHVKPHSKLGGRTPAEKVGDLFGGMPLLCHLKLDHSELEFSASDALAGKEAWHEGIEVYGRAEGVCDQAAREGTPVTEVCHTALTAPGTVGQLGFICRLAVYSR